MLVVDYVLEAAASKYELGKLMQSKNPFCSQKQNCIGLLQKCMRRLSTRHNRLLALSTSECAAAAGVVFISTKAKQK